MCDNIIKNIAKKKKVSPLKIESNSFVIFVLKGINNLLLHHLANKLGILMGLLYFDTVKQQDAESTHKPLPVHCFGFEDTVTLWLIGLTLMPQMDCLPWIILIIVQLQFLDGFDLFCIQIVDSKTNITGFR